MKASVLMAAVLGGLISTASWAAPSYSLKDFGANSWVFDINNLGQVVGSVLVSPGQAVGFEWSQTGGMQAAGGTQASLGELPAALNDRGQIVFVRYFLDPNDPSQLQTATEVRNADGSTVQLPAPPSYYNAGFVVRSINNAGQVAGNGVRHFGNEDIAEFGGLVWTPGQGYAALEPSPAGNFTSTEAIRINDAGEVVWARVRSDPTNSGFDYRKPVFHTSDGQDIELPLPLTGQDNAVPGINYASGLNDQGVVAGYVTNGWVPGAPGAGAFLWSQASGLRYIGGPNTAAVGINDKGTVLGVLDGQMALWTETGGWQLLSSMLSGSDAQLLTSVDYFMNLNLMNPPDINNLGQIILNTNVDGVNRALLLTPVPEPTTLSLMMGGIGFMGWRVRRSQAATA
jgi:hypothetical protein